MSTGLPNSFFQVLMRCGVVGLSLLLAFFIKRPNHKNRSTLPRQPLEY